mmetsp:Transcript_35368/g.101884  ORF Transcript_35368/g.101884 Transcript_35368/m.101884 type:complete len:320 (+) Transcript_35368:2824-3783(+)
MAEQGQAVQLRCGCRHSQCLLRGAQRQAPWGSAVELDRLRPAVDLLWVVTLLKHSDETIVAAGDETLGEGQHTHGRSRLTRRALQHGLELTGIVEEHEVPALATHEQLVVAQPAMAQKALQLGRRRRQRLEGAVLYLKDLENAIADHTHQSGVCGIERALPDWRALSVGDRHRSERPGLVPLPVNQRPIVLSALRSAGLRQEVLVVSGEGHANELGSIAVRQCHRRGQCLALLPGDEIEHRDDRPLAALLRDGEVPLCRVDRQACDALRAFRAMEELLLLLVGHPQDGVCPRGVDDLRLLCIVYAVLYIGLQAEDVPVG